ASTQPRRLSFLLLTATAFCQTLGEISGQVTDSTGGAIPGAKVVATNVDTNAAREVVTNEAGVYSFPSLQPGTYNVRVEKSGFKAVTRTNVLLEVQQSARLDVELPLGQVSETIPLRRRCCRVRTRRSERSSAIR